jgi:hypothetical protein
MLGVFFGLALWTMINWFAPCVGAKRLVEGFSQPPPATPLARRRLQQPDFGKISRNNGNFAPETYFLQRSKQRAFLEKRSVTS